MVAGASNEITARKGKFAMLVILGDQHKELAKMASRRANEDDPPKWVLWVESAQGLNGLMDDIRSLSESSQLLQMLQRQPEKVVGFAVSPKGKVVDIIMASDIIDEVRVDDAFLNATIS